MSATGKSPALVLHHVEVANFHSLVTLSSPKMVTVNKKVPAPLGQTNVTGTPTTPGATVDSAVDMTFPAGVLDLGNKSPTHDKGHPTANLAPIVEADSSTSTQYRFATIEGMPFKFDQITVMGDALTKARREKMFPPTTTPSYNMKAIIDDYADLERLNAAREVEGDVRDHASHPDIARLYIAIQRRIQDRDLTQGEVAADANVRARIGGLANGASAETGMYNLMRHAVQSVLRLNSLTTEDDSNIVDAAASRVIDSIRSTVQAQASHGINGVNEGNMEDVMNQVFGAIEYALGNRVESQANRLDANANRFDVITTAQSAQVNAIAGHVNAIDNHVHAMGNNVGAMSSLVNSTNSNVTTLSTSVGALQNVINMIPQMVSQVAGKMLQDMLPGIIGPAVEQAFELAISNELAARMSDFVNAVQTAQARTQAANNTPRGPPTKKSGRRTWFRFFKR